MLYLLYSFNVQYDGCTVLMHFHISNAPCGPRGCKNRPAPFPGRMSYKVTKPGLVLFYILECFNCIVAYQGPILCIVNFSCMCSVFWLL